MGERGRRILIESTVHVSSYPKTERRGTRGLNVGGVMPETAENG